MSDEEAPDAAAKPSGTLSDKSSRPRAVKAPVGRPPQLTLDQILDAVPRVGLADLSLHALARELGVTTPALYRYFRNKEDLEASFVAHITHRFPIESLDGETWDAWAVRFAYALRDMYVAVPGLADFTIRQTHTSDSVLIRHEISVAAAMRSGFTPAEALYATRVLVEFVAGWVAREQRREVTANGGMHPDERFFEGVVASGRYPNLEAALHAARKEAPGRRFEFSLNAIIGGLLASRSAHAACPPR